MLDHETASALVSCHVANVGTESDAVLDRQGVATRHSGGYGEETQRRRPGCGAARMPRLLRDMALVLLGLSTMSQTTIADAQSSSEFGQSASDTLSLSTVIDRTVAMLVHDGLEIAGAPATIGSDDLPLLAAISGGFLLLAIQDEPIRERILETDLSYLDRNRDVIEPFGRVQVIQLLSGASYLAGHLTDDERLKRVGALGWESSVFTGILTGFFKLSAGRERPFKEKGGFSFRPFSGASSWPSSHAAQAFCLATVLSDEYGAPVSYIAYSMASLVALSRIREDLHWTTDVFAGALLGHFVSRILCGIHPSEHNRKRSNWLRLSIGYIPSLPGY